MATNNWLVYVLKCKKGEFYIGITTDMAKRWKKHEEGKASKYTRSHKPVEICYQTGAWLNRSQALRIERYFKGLSHKMKKQLFGKA